MNVSEPTSGVVRVRRKGYERRKGLRKEQRMMEENVGKVGCIKKGGGG